MLVSYSLYKISVHYLTSITLTSLLPLSTKMAGAGNHFTVNVFNPDIAMNMIATAPTEFPDTEIWFRLSGQISQEGYQMIVNDMILSNATRNRADRIVNQRPAPFLPPPTIPILTLDEFRSAFAERETPFMIYVPGHPVVDPNVRQAIINTAIINGVEVDPRPPPEA